MKTIEIYLPADNITLSYNDMYTVVCYTSLFNGKQRMFVSQVIGYFTEFTLTDNLLTLK